MWDFLVCFQNSLTRTYVAIHFNYTPIESLLSISKFFCLYPCPFFTGVSTNTHTHTYLYMAKGQSTLKEWIS